MTSSLTEEYPKIVAILRRLAEENKLSPIDKLARAISPSMVYTALYEALRAARSLDNPPELPSQEEIEKFIEKSARDLTLPQKIALIAITAAKPKKK